MRVLDLTHVISQDMPVYPGTPQPRLTLSNDYEPDLFRETLLTMCSHTGTHMDAPAHVLPGHVTLDRLPADRFVGTALVIDCTGLQPGEEITAALLPPEAEQAEFLLFCTGWDRYWGAPEYFSDFPTLSPDLARQLAESGKKGVGIDTISIDPVNSLAAHRALFGAGDTVIVENLTGLDRVGKGLFSFCALPLRYLDADGSPVRALALLSE